MTVTDQELIDLFSKVGFGEKKSGEIVKNKKVSNFLYEILSSTASDGLDDKKLALLHQLAVESKGAVIPHRETIVSAIIDGRIKTNLQISGGVAYVKNVDVVDEVAFNDAAGVGKEMSESDVKAVISQYITDNKADIESKRYTMVPKVLGELKKLPELKWAAPSLFKPIIDELFLALLGPKDERDVVKKEKKKKAAPTKDSPVEKERSMFLEGFLGELHKPGEQPQKYPELLVEQNRITQGRVFTRFPPEPNGFLHIGHSKAIMVNFGYAQYHDGVCYLRFDDTNPEAEEDVYFRSILGMVDWLGYKPWKVTYSSDYFDELYALAEKLVQVGKAYVCHCTSDEVKKHRGLKEDGTLGGARTACAERDADVETNLRKFRAMRDGEYQVGEATLRMKQDLESPSPQMWDLVAYRVLNTPHQRTGDKWKIYPTYDFTHCLVDSFESITHALCTTEFRLSRESYEWLCDELKVYRPAQREYGRLNIEGTVLSKRKIAKLVNSGIVRAWNDPRLYTLEAIRRRGVPPGAILSFINTLGVTTSTTNIQVIRFESAVRGFLDHTTPRLMMVLDPVEVIVENVEDDYEEVLEIPYKPGKGGESFGSRKVTFSKRVFIDRSDVRDTPADPDYFRLAPGQPLGLMKVPHTLSYVRSEKDAQGKIVKVYVNYDKESTAKPKTFVQWVPQDNIKVKQVRIYKQLFKSENPSAHPEGYLADIHEDSEEIVEGALVERSFNEIKAKSPLNVAIEGSEFNIKEKEGPETIRFQALRVGYFCADTDSTDSEVILNRMVTLKEDSSKSS